MMTAEEHRQRHIELHRMLDELVADFIVHADALPTRTTLIEFMQWSFQQTIVPDEPKGK